MNFKRSTTSMAIALMALSLVSMTSIQQEAFALNQGMSITATTEKTGNMITITGKTVSDYDITFTVVSPSGNNVVGVNQISPDNDGNFATTFTIGSGWKENGFYSINAKQGTSSLYEVEVLVEVTNGVTLRSTSVTEGNLETGIFKPNVNNAARDMGIILDEIIAEEGDTMFGVTGTTDIVSQDITLKVIAPNGNVVKVAQVSPMLDGEFSAEITVGGPLWKQDGDYIVTVRQFDDPKYTASTKVGIKDGVVIPEFGTIAAMILAVAIISVIAVSAKSRLSIIPRY
ncbi:MAG: PEFG-CTERM sorting domain-containing protein [Nitrosopumilus sp.]|nr:PEFG-CTERM sorting domain-containing protein [Nitrosopumilus sp.]MDF2426211.1 PEFG-CTERM sorting domain-containing protein [Nitrosopumilus sp.]MDF2426674.1 PEFG-CTERM sorting domain-containing protein [Nitrosopumilus sp.]MDF2430330.1 PEFG-CTERM sorting domain-containing protein [Nitrosopumilus sp.]